MAASAPFKSLSAVLVSLALAGAALAQVDPASRPASEKQPTAPKRPRSISPEVAAQLSANTPRFDPNAPKPEPKKPVAVEELPDMRDIDKPRNGIIRLPQVTVQEQKTPVLHERTVYTEKGLADIAVRRYISEADRALNRFTIPLFGTSTQSRALAMYEEDERLRNMSDLKDNAAMVSTRDREAGQFVRKESQKTYMRTSDFGWSSGEPR